MTTLFHADDYGITADQANSILALSSACGGQGALNSVSMFANSPAFDTCAALVRNHVAAGKVRIALHANVVEGHPCADPADIPLLIGPRKTFCNDFMGLLRLAKGPHGVDLRKQLEIELSAQLERFLRAFPEQKAALRLDSHQHTHAIPVVLDALLAAARAHDCTLEHVRTPVEPLRPYAASAHARRGLSAVNLGKDALLAMLWRQNRGKLPPGCATSLFCGVALSGHMDRVDGDLVHAFEDLAKKRALPGNDANGLADAAGKDRVEILFHPVSVPRALCLDPENEPFASACASPSRDAEAQTLMRLGAELAR